MRVNGGSRAGGGGEGHVVKDPQNVIYCAFIYHAALTVRGCSSFPQGFKDYHVFTTAPRSAGDILEDRDRVLRKGEKDDHVNKDGNLVTLPSHRYSRYTMHESMRIRVCFNVVVWHQTLMMPAVKAFLHRIRSSMRIPLVFRYTAAHYLLASDKAAKDADPSLPQRSRDQREANEWELLHVRFTGGLISYGIGDQAKIKSPR